MGDVLATQTLYFVCPEAIVADHPVLKGRTVVQIGMKKQSFLNVVFKRFVDYCNEKLASSSLSSSTIALADLEFVHATVLNGDDNAEGAALMKNDRITVRREQEDDRCATAKHAREQRDSERYYFEQFAGLVVQRPLLLPAAAQGPVDDMADVILNCQQGGSSLNGLVHCHSFMIRARCAWLWGLIEDARKLENGRQSVLTLPVDAEDHEHDCADNDDNDDDDGRIVDIKNYQPVKVEESPAAAHIESDEDDRAGVRDHATDHSVTHAPNKVWVNVPYSAEAVRILLEYCYTNRVFCLGLEAFSKACKKQSIFKKNTGPVPPITMRHNKWPNMGVSTVTMATALEATRLAHVAGFPRLALMCEVAASNHVTFDNVVEALIACETIETEYGSPLVHLRKIAMRILIQTDYDFDGGVGDFLKYALKEKGSLLVPTLLAGTNQLLEASHEDQKNKHSSQSPISVSARTATPRNKRDWKTSVYSNLEKFDRADALERARERKRRRKLKRGEEVAAVANDGWAVRFAQGLVENRLQKMWPKCGVRSASKIMAPYVPAKSAPKAAPKLQQQQARKPAAPRRRGGP